MATIQRTVSSKGTVRYDGLEFAVGDGGLLPPLTDVVGRRLFVYEAPLGQSIWRRLLLYSDEAHRHFVTHADAKTVLPGDDEDDDWEG